MNSSFVKYSTDMFYSPFEKQDILQPTKVDFGAELTKVLFRFLLSRFFQQFQQLELVSTLHA